MTADITYRYQSPSFLVSDGGQDMLQLSHFNENDAERLGGALFRGRLLQPEITARCLVNIAEIVRSKFTISAHELAVLRDPIISAGSGKIRFEGFSGCAGLYARLDVPPEALDGDFLGDGTTNVDFNTVLISSLSKVGSSDDVRLSVGQSDIAMDFGGDSVVEKKVPLPVRWIKSLTSVQSYLAEAELLAELGRVQALRLLKSVPRGASSSEFHLARRGGGLICSVARAAGSIAIKGVQRLHAIAPLLPYADGLRVYAPASGSCTIWQLLLGDLRFTFALSCEPYRGFSGEGGGLENLIPDIQPEQMLAMSRSYRVNQEFTLESASAFTKYLFEPPARIAGCLSAMGMLGYDLDSAAYFYRGLPFKPERILSLNPRLKNALKIVADGRMRVTVKDNGSVEALVPGSGVWHTVMIDGDESRCTCAWSAQYGTSRGLCKHILAVKKYVQDEK